MTDDDSDVDSLRKPEYRSLSAMLTARASRLCCRRRFLEANVTPDVPDHAQCVRQVDDVASRKPRPRDGVAQGESNDWGANSRDIAGAALSVGPTLLQRHTRRMLVGATGRSSSVAMLSAAESSWSRCRRTSRNGNL